MKTGKRHTLLSIVLLGALLLGASVTVHAACPTNNRDLKLGCGHDIILVLDESSSIAYYNPHKRDYTSDVVAGAKALLDAFKNTGSRVAMVEFGNVSRLVKVPGYIEGSYVPITDTTLRTTFNAYLDNRSNRNPDDRSGYNPTRSPLKYTNWQQALIHVLSIHASTYTPARGPADLVVFLTDGNPTVSANCRKQSPFSPCAHREAIRAANNLKNSGPDYPHMFVVAVGGSIPTSHITDISGCEQLTLRPPPTMSQVTKSDFTKVRFDQLIELFRDIAFALCGNSVNVTKLIDPDGPDFPGQPALAPNIEIKASVLIQETGVDHAHYEWVAPEEAGSCTSPLIPDPGKACPGPGPASSVGTTQNAWTSSTATLNFDWVAGSVAHPESRKSWLTLGEVFLPAHSSLVYREMSCLRKRLEHDGSVTETIFTCYRKRHVSLLPDQPTPACEEDPDNVHVWPARKECGSLAFCEDLDVAGGQFGDGSLIVVYPNDIVTCEVINDDVSRLPATLNHFNSTLEGESIEFKWDTLSETDMLGFRLWAVVEGQRVTLGERLVLSNSSTSATPQSYKVRRSTAGLAGPVETVGITSVDIGGAEQDFGPYNIGETFGEQVEPNAIDWQTINSSVDEEMEKAGYTKSGKRWVRQGAAPASGDPGVGNAEIME